MKEIKNILFDLDGTIIEPAEGIINSVIYALNKLGVKEANKEELKNFIGSPLIDSFANGYKLTATKANQAVSYYREFFSEKGIYQNTVYENITYLLDQLNNKGFCLFVATSKPTVYAKKIISHYKLDNYFKEVVGSNLDNTRKDKTEIIEYVIRKFDLKRNETLMIGDTKYDIIGGKNNLIKTIGVLYGHGNIQELKDTNPDFTVKNCLELLEIIIKG